jgi:hypothetical protein
MMLKIEFIKFEAQDVITTSIPHVNVVPGGAPVNPEGTCYCSPGCEPMYGFLQHTHPEKCTKCVWDNYDKHIYPYPYN